MTLQLESDLSCVNMGNICLSYEAKTRRLAAKLNTGIEHGSLDDVKALLRRGAPVNSIHVRRLVDVICNQSVNFLQLTAP